MSDTDEKVIFNSMGTIFYNNIQLRTFDTPIPNPDNDSLYKNAHEIIDEKQTEIKRELNEYIKSCIEQTKNNDDTFRCL